MWLVEDVATILCCCAKLVFMPLNIGLWCRAGFSNYGLRPEMGSRTVILWLRNQLAWQIRCKNFCKITWKLKVGLWWFYFYCIIILWAKSHFTLSVVYCHACLSCQMIIKTRHNCYALLHHDCFNVRTDNDLIAFIPTRRHGSV